MRVDTKSAREFANSGYSYTGEEVRVWVHNMADEIERLRNSLGELVALVRGECPSLLNEDSGGNGGLSLEIDDLLTKA